jgi:hypothetical protein
MSDTLTRTLELFEQLAGDDNDLDMHGMDAMQRKRLKVGRLMQKKKVKPRKPMRSKLPYSMANVPKMRDESRLRERGYLSEAKRVNVNARKGSFEIVKQDPNKPYIPYAKGNTIREKVSGYIVGNVGIHKLGSRWLTTHIPTGLGGGHGWLDKLWQAKLYAEMLNAIIPKTSDVGKAQDAAHRHYDEARRYSKYLEDGGTDHYAQWKKEKR